MNKKETIHKAKTLADTNRLMFELQVKIVEIGLFKEI